MSLGIKCIRKKEGGGVILLKNFQNALMVEIYSKGDVKRKYALTRRFIV